MKRIRKISAVCAATALLCLPLSMSALAYEEPPAVIEITDEEQAALKEAMENVVSTSDNPLWNKEWTEDTLITFTDGTNTYQICQLHLNDGSDRIFICPMKEDEVTFRIELDEEYVDYFTKVLNKMNEITMEYSYSISAE